MPLNLVRNSKVFFTTNVDTTGKINASTTQAFSAANTIEIQVLDGFSFSQNTNQETVTISEAGTTPARGQRSFNTSLAPVDFSFSTYLRPGSTGSGTSKRIVCEESVLWNALMSSAAIPSSLTNITGVTGVTLSATGVLTITGAAMTNLPAENAQIMISGIATTLPAPDASNEVVYANGVGTVTGTPSATSITVQMLNYSGTAVTSVTFVNAGTISYTTTKAGWSQSNNTFSQLSAAFSETNQLQAFGMLFLVDNVLYAVDNCALNQVTVDFGLDQIATAQWTGQATALREFGTGVTATGGTFAGAGANVGTGAYTPKITTSGFITNKLSTVDLVARKAIGTSVAAGDSYVVPITGGNFTINNNITYITPANLGIVNQPVTYYTGTRAISGSLNAYLRTGETKVTGELLADMLAEAATNVEPMFALQVNIGGKTATARVELDMDSTVIGIPAINVEQVVGTTINFTAQGYKASATAANNVFDIARATDLLVRYYS
jgi:hypothetical protein